MEKSQKCQIIPIFLIAEIYKIDLEAFVLQNFKNPHGKNFDIWVRIQFVQKKISLGDNRFYRGRFLDFVT